MEEKIITELLRLAKKAAKLDEVPISAIIVKNNKIIAKAYNKRTKNHNVLAHAEIIAIKNATKKLKDWRLFNCDLYVTLKPCSMCESVINQTRIKNVYYLLDKPKEKKEYYKTEYIKIKNDSEQKYAKILSNYFKLKRKKS